MPVRQFITSHLIVKGHYHSDLQISLLTKKLMTTNKPVMSPVMRPIITDKYLGKEDKVKQMTSVLSYIYGKN